MRSVIHKFIKSSNIMSDSSFNSKLGDFCLAKIKTIDGVRTYHQYDICFHFKAINTIYMLNLDKI